MSIQRNVGFSKNEYTQIILNILEDITFTAGNRYFKIISQLFHGTLSNVCAKVPNNYAVIEVRFFVESQDSSKIPNSHVIILIRDGLIN